MPGRLPSCLTYIRPFSLPSPMLPVSGALGSLFSPVYLRLLWGELTFVLFRVDNWGCMVRWAISLSSVVIPTQNGVNNDDLELDNPVQVAIYTFEVITLKSCASQGQHSSSNPESRLQSLNFHAPFYPPSSVPHLFYRISERCCLGLAQAKSRHRGHFLWLRCLLTSDDRSAFRRFVLIIM